MGKPFIRKRTLVLALLCLSGVLGGCDNAKDLPLLSRYVAKNVCVSHWVEGYELEAAQSYVSNVAPLIRSSWESTLQVPEVITKNRWFPWVSTKSAQLLTTESQSECRNDYPETPLQPVSLTSPSDLSAGFINQVNPESALQKYLESVVAVGAPEYTTALLVLHGNQVVAEAYRDGIDQHSPLKGFSMSKSFANLLVGRLYGAGQLSLHQPMNIAAWQEDDRAYISWHNSLRMSSGLDWHEAAMGENNDQGQMLYNSQNPAQYAQDKALLNFPGSLFNYSSGDYMNLSAAVVDQFENWFNPGWDLGGEFALEFSPDGQYPLLAEGVLLTTRGWAALASIYMNQGQLAGQQILTADWVEYSITPSETNYDYGAGIWLNWGQSFFPQLPTDTLIFAGSYDRYVVAIPSQNLVVVRMGFSAQPGDFDMQRFVLNAMELVGH